MNANQAKQISLIDLLAKLQHHPVKTVHRDAWYISPFRDEKTPSFKVDVGRNIWC